MKIIKILLLTLILSVSLSSCSFFRKNKSKPAAESGSPEKEAKAPDKTPTAKPAKPIDMKNMTEMVFGWGGGFTGMVEEYHLHKNGTLKKGNEDLKNIDSKQMKKILAAFKKVNFSKVKLNDPGNLYYFMAAKSADNEQRLIWNDQTTLPAEVKTAYDELINVTK